MVKLYGVTHTMGSNLSLMGVSPAIELLDDLATFPTGSRVGIEWFEVAHL